MEETLSSTNTSTKQQWIAEQAEKHPERVFTSLHHLIDEEWMLEAYRRTRKDGATGIDGVTAADYEKELEANLADLSNRIKSGRYYAPPVRRPVHPQGGRITTPSGHPDLRRQGGAAGNTDAPGADLRGGLPSVLIRLPTRAVGPQRPRVRTCGGHGRRPPVGDRRRYQEVLRHNLASAPEKLP